MPRRVCLKWDIDRVQVFQSFVVEFSVSIMPQFKGETLRKVVQGEWSLWWEEAGEFLERIG